MAHFIYEYSANLPTEQLDLQALMAKMHTAAAATGVFPLSGMRSRATRCDDYRIGDGNPNYGFLNLSMKVGHGRELETRMAMGRTLFELLIEHLQPVFASRGLAVSFEMRELEEYVKFNHRNI